MKQESRWSGITCKSCGSFRHLLNAFLHSLENIVKNNTDVKPLNQGSTEKTRGDIIRAFSDFKAFFYIF